MEPKQKAKKSCLVCLASYCSDHLENHSVERLKGHKLVEPVENLDTRACLIHGRPLELYSKKQQKCILNIEMDPATAHQRLVLSPDGKEVQDGGENQEVADSPKRFDVFGSVLGLNSLTTGKSYWEVEVNNKAGWDLGVARGSADRKGRLTLSPENGYWVLVHYEEENYAAMTAPPICLSLEEKPKKVGVFVDYEENLLSFYNVMTQSHIYSFMECSFKDELYPYFSPHMKQDKMNSEALVISTGKHFEKDEK
ncbi:hypothetical protein XENOCAPTIV_001113 [Xenoophorus captivus]|uniref:B30.2/SPRY domain-containing protein n=1 Tax=Xenoophorus captivus TaxID=1517983 RepID=A0ABV0S594_9TELE